MRIPSLRALRAFEAAARYRSFSKASEDLCVSRSAISHQVQNVEDQLGVSLFNRIGRKIELTKEGEALLFGITRAFIQIEQVSSQVANPDSPLHQSMIERLSIIVPPGFSMVWLNNNLPKFLAEYPHIKFEIISSTDLSQIDNGKKHFAITWKDQIFPDFNEMVLYEAVLFPVCSPDLIKNRPIIKKPEDIMNYPLIHTESTESWSAWFLEHGMEAASLKGHFTNDLSLNNELAVAGLGISLSSKNSASKYLDSGELVKPLDTGWDFKTRVRLLNHPAAMKNPAAAFFRDWIIKNN